jgi:hypothetical protein
MSILSLLVLENWPRIGERKNNVGPSTVFMPVISATWEAEIRKIAV